jgi:hypothetical protein
MENNQANSGDEGQATIRSEVSCLPMVRQLVKGPQVRTQTSSPEPPPSTGQWLDDYLASLQEEQDEHAQSGAMDAKREWTARMRAKRLGLK